MSPRSYRPLYKRGAAFAAGVGFSAVPTVGPFLAILAFFTGKLEIQRADIWWWISAFLLGVPLLLDGDPAYAALSASQVIAVWLIYRSAIEFRKSLRHDAITRDIGAGLVMGLGITLALGLRQLGDFRFDAAITTLDAIVWRTHPALFGHAILVLSSLLAIVVPSPRLRVVSLVLGAIGVVFSGSGEAAWAWIIIAVGLRWAGRRGTRLTRASEWVLIGLMVLLISGAGQYIGLGRTGFLTEFAPSATEENLFRGTEVPSGDWWFPLGVTFSSQTTNFDGAKRLALRVQKEWTEPWARLQQAVTLTPGTTYTLSAALNADPDLKPGFDGWGRQSPTSTAANLAATVEGGALRTSTTGDIAVISTSVVSLDDVWRRAYVTFRYGGAEPLTWYIGVVPDRATQAGVSIQFSELQLTTSYTLLPYRPGTATRGVTDLRNSRLPVWRDALKAIGARPLIGWGVGGLPLAINSLHPDETLLRPIASHAHNMFLSIWVERGILGVIGILGLLTMLSLRVIQQRDRAVAVVLFGVMILNLFDATLLSAAVIYPLAAVLGWRAVGHRKAATHETGAGSALFTRLSLALADYTVALLAFGAAYFMLQTRDPQLAAPLNAEHIAYLACAWPLLNSVLGQYPGYGRPSWQELQYSVLASIGAGALITVIGAVLGGVTTFPLRSLALATVIATVAAPFARSLTKSVLARLRVWGRPVIVVGSGGSADQVTKMLTAQPQLGLHPVALIDESKQASTDPHTGLVHAASMSQSIARRARHVIVVPGAEPSDATHSVLRAAGRTAFGIVQVVPNLLSVPSTDVSARPLGRSLSLQVRNNLAFPHNRFAKRAFDIVMVACGSVLAGPLLVAIAVAIRMDSPGSPFYRQLRVGRDGKSFFVWKFRSMVIDADEQLKVLLATNAGLRQEWDETQKLVNDPRVTRVGRFLRKTSLDELPQLWNVVKGEMSLVGPRPIIDEEIEKYKDDYRYYTQVRPGMTGAWQVSGRSDTSYEFRVELDTYYVRNWNLWLDLDILVKTVGVVLKREGAY